MRNGLSVALVIPARNEGEALPGVLRRVPAWVDRVVVADNGSTDETADVARRAGAQVVHVPIPGYGRACAEGSAAALAAGADVVAYLDADGSDDPRELPRVLDPVVHGIADLVVGRRQLEGRMPPHQRLGTAFVCAVLSAGFGRRVRDLGPFRALRASTLAELGMRDRAFGWTAEMQARALRFGLGYREVPVSWRPGAGRSEITGTWRGVARAAFGLTVHSLRQILAAWLERGAAAVGGIASVRPRRLAGR